VPISQLSTSNTFGQWLNTTVSIIDTLNNFTDGGAANTFFANTNLEVANNLTVGGNLTVSGNVTLDNIGYNDLIVSGNATVNGTISGGNTTVSSLIVTGNISKANITTTLTVGSNTRVHGNLTLSQNTTVANLQVTNSANFGPLTNVTVQNLTVTQNITSDTVNVTDLNVTNNVVVDNVTANIVTTDTIVITGNAATLNVTANAFIGQDAYVYGNLIVSGITNISNIASINIASANITTLIGAANNDIYAYINATANSASAAALAEDYLALAIALG